MTRGTRPALLVSVGMVASAQTVWAYRQSFGADPEVHMVSEAGVPLTAAEARVLVPWAGGLDYSECFFDGLAARRFSMVLPLLEVNDGTIQGLLEFLGVPYAGCGMTGVLLAHDQAYSRAVLDSLGVPFWGGRTESSVPVAVLGNDELVTASSDPGAEAAALLVYRGLGLSGWALIDMVPLGDQWYWHRVQVQPDLGPGAPFLALLQARGLGPSSVMDQVLGWGQVRHDSEVGLKNSFKDRI